MTRMTLFRQLAEDATQSLEALATPEDAQAVTATQANSTAGTPTGPLATPDGRDLFVWFEDTSERQAEGEQGIAGLPESLLPISYGMKVIERRYAAGHLHLLTAIRIRCPERTNERVAAIYTAALAVGTVAWMGTGTQYELAWNALYAAENEGLDQA